MTVTQAYAILIVFHLDVIINVFGCIYTAIYEYIVINYWPNMFSDFIPGSVRIQSRNSYARSAMQRN